MRPPWPHLALRSLVRGGPAWLRCGIGWPWLTSSGAARSGKTFNSVAFDCIWLHSYRLRGRWGCARTLILTFSQGEKGSASVASLWPRLASSGVVRSGKTFKTLSFSLISSHSSRRQWRRGLGCTATVAGCTTNHSLPDIGVRGVTSDPFWFILIHSLSWSRCLAWGFTLIPTFSQGRLLRNSAWRT